MYEEENETEVTNPAVEAQVLWLSELKAAHREVEEFHERGDKIVDQYGESRKVRRTRKYPLFNANVSILENALFARIPRPDVARRFKDPDDQVGRVASLILQRALITELEGATSFKNVAKSIIKDMLVPGAGIGWVRYVADVQEAPQLTEDTTAELAEFQSASPVIRDQQTPIDYVPWKDFRWSPCRTWSECRWVARRVYLDEDEATERFPEGSKWLSFDTVPDKSKRTSVDTETENDIKPQAAVWEIWDKTTKKVYFICETCPVALDIQDDFLGLPEFFPTDKPLVANITTSAFIPVADYTIIQDQYNELNEINNRISRLVRACRLAGVYDQSEPGVKLLLEGAAEHQLVPIKNFSGFAEKGGLNGAVDFLPLEAVVTVIGQLNQAREAIKQQIYELTGISDIVRGASNPYETAAAQGMKAQYASIRLQGKQTDVAEYLTSMIQRKAFLMLKFYEPQRLLERCGTLSQADQQHIPAAIQLLQNELMTSLKLEISSDSLQQPNWAKEQNEKAQTLISISTFLREAIPATQQIPQLGPLFLHLIKWNLAGNPGARDIEGVIEMGLQQLLTPQEQAPKGPSPEEQAAQASQQRMQAELQLSQQKAQVEMQMKQSDLQMKMEMAQQELALKGQLAQQELNLKREQIGAEISLKREVEMTKASTKQMPTMVSGNVGLDEQKFAEVIAQMQQSTISAIAALQESTIAAITALANQPQEPAKVTMSRDANGNLVGTIQ